MKKYLEKHKESSDRRSGHPALTEFYRSLEYGDRKALKEFLKENEVFRKGEDIQEMRLAVRETVGALLQGEYYQEVGVLEQRLGTEIVGLAIEGDREVHGMYEGYRNRGTRKAQKNQHSEQPTDKGTSIAKSAAALALFSAIVALITYYVRFRRSSRQQKTPTP